MGKKRKKSFEKFYKHSVIAAFVVVVLTAGVVSYRYIKLSSDKKRFDKTNTGVVKQQTISPTPTQAESLQKEHVSEDYGYKVKYHKFLDAREYVDPEDYMNFVKFEENQFSSTKGFAIGVTKRSKEEEKNKITAEFKEEFEVDIESEREIKVEKYDGVKLSYSQKEDLEARSIVVVNNGSYTYSISTVPEQMEDILSNFNFL